MPHEKSPEQGSRAAQIARLNDAFRHSVRDIYLTQGVQALPDVPGLLRAVRTFHDFTEDNNPYGERDFGSITWHQEKTYWKIDYYDQELEYWYDPLSEECRRVMTVMLASEY